MKNIKTFQIFESEGENPLRGIQKRLLDEVCTDRWNWNRHTKKVDVMGSFRPKPWLLNHLHDMSVSPDSRHEGYEELKEKNFFGIEFGEVTGDFSVTDIKDIKTLDGFPEVIRGSLDLTRTGITSLKGPVRSIGHRLYVNDCPDLRTFDCEIDYVGMGIGGNDLPNLKDFNGLPKRIDDIIILSKLPQNCDMSGIRDLEEIYLKLRLVYGDILQSIEISTRDIQSPYDYYSKIFTVLRRPKEKELDDLIHKEIKPLFTVFSKEETQKNMEEEPEKWTILYRDNLDLIKKIPYFEITPPKEYEEEFGDMSDLIDLGF